MACQQSQRLAAWAEKQRNCNTTDGQQHMTSCQRIGLLCSLQLTRTKTENVCASTPDASSNEPVGISQFFGPPQPSPQFIVLPGAAASAPACQESPAQNAVMVIGQVKHQAPRLQQFGRGLTRRSSADPLRHRTGPARPSLSIIGLAGPVRCRSGPLSSNVRRHRKHYAEPPCH